MFDSLIDSIDNALNVTGSVLTGEDVSQKQVSRLIADGIVIATGAVIADVATDIVKDVLDDKV